MSLKADSKILFKYTDAKGVKSERTGVINYLKSAKDGKPIVNIFDETRNGFRSFDVARMRHIVTVG